MNDQGEAGDPLVGGTYHDLNECATDNDDCGGFTDCTIMMVLSHVLVLHAMNGLMIMIFF